MVRYYDKYAESKGKIDSYRWELAVRDELAQKLLADYVSILPDEYESLAPQYLASTVTGAISFKDNSGGSDHQGV